MIRIGHERELFDADLGECDGRGPIELPAGDEYELRVYSDERDTGSYSFKLWDAPVETFAIAVGDTVAPGVPGPGAGEIETPGSRDVYTFSAQAGQSIFLDVQAVKGDCETPNDLWWELWRKGASERETWDYFYDYCKDGGPIKLSVGSYRLTVGGNADEIGTYEFTLRRRAA